MGTEKKNDSKQAQLNLGGIIALGVFGGFVFLAAIITTIVILIRRKEQPGESTFRSTSLESEVDREHSEMVVNSHAAHNKHERKHHHRHHHHHKHRSHSHSSENERHSGARSRY